MKLGLKMFLLLVGAKGVAYAKTASEAQQAIGQCQYNYPGLSVQLCMDFLDQEQQAQAAAQANFNATGNVKDNTARMVDNTAGMVGAGMGWSNEDFRSKPSKQLAQHKRT